MPRVSSFIPELHIGMPLLARLSSPVAPQPLWHYPSPQRSYHSTRRTKLGWDHGAAPFVLGTTLVLERRRAWLRRTLYRCASSTPVALEDAFSTIAQTRVTVTSGDWPRERILPVPDFLERMTPGRAPVVFDVRAPEEFEQGHIPSAENLPLLGNVHRREVGRLHKQEGQEEAFDFALECVYPSLPYLLEQARKRCTEVGETVGERLPAFVYCKRGGMRSRSTAAFLAAHGFEVFTLEGGYKAFRRWADAVLQRPQKVCVIGGATGSGKTEVLGELRKLQLQTIDLEALACHKGSVFGHLGEPPQPSSEHFRNLLALQWNQLAPNRFVFMEDEGPRIGGTHLPAATYRKLRQAQLVVHLDVPFDLRLERSLATYGPFGPEALSAAVECFRKRMGNARTDLLLEQLARGDLRSVCREALTNYDVNYEHHLFKGRSEDAFEVVTVSSLDAKAVAVEVAALAGGREASVSAEELPKVKPGAERVARCYCGAVEVRVRGEPLSVSICHCSICRRLSGAPFVASALFDPRNVTLNDAELLETQTSTHVVRKRCATCFSPVMASVGKKYVAVPLSLFSLTPQEAWKPQQHLHYEDRVIDVNDEIPKYANRSGGDLWKDEAD